jgi:hypothetical protein
MEERLDLIKGQALGWQRIHLVRLKRRSKRFDDRIVFFFFFLKRALRLTVGLCYIYNSNSRDSY